MAKRRTSAVGSGNRSAGGGHGVSKATSNANTAKTKPKPLVPGAKQAASTAGFAANIIGRGIANTDKALANVASKNPVVQGVSKAVGLGTTAAKQAVQTATNNNKGSSTSTSKNTPPSTTTKSTPQTSFARPGGPTSATSKRAPTKTTPAKTYTVQAGDNLWNISKKQFGGTSNSDISSSTKSLWDKNKGVVGKGGSIKPGDTLTF